MGSTSPLGLRGRWPVDAPSPPGPFVHSPRVSRLCLTMAPRTHPRPPLQLAAAQLGANNIARGSGWGEWGTGGARLLRAGWQSRAPVILVHAEIALGQAQTLFAAIFSGD